MLDSGSATTSTMTSVVVTLMFEACCREHSLFFCQSRLFHRQPGFAFARFQNQLLQLRELFR